MGILKANIKPDTPDTRPKTLNEALQLIARIYKLNEWTRHEQKAYLEMLGLSDKTVENYTHEEAKMILADFERLRMVLYGNNSNEQIPEQNHDR